MLNDCQLITALSEVWLTWTVLGDGFVIVALPPATSPPTGLASADKVMSEEKIKTTRFVSSSFENSLRSMIVTDYTLEISLLSSYKYCFYEEILLIN